MRITTLIILIVIILSCCYNGFGQNYKSQQNEIFAYNILANGLICGVSSTFNKKKEEKFFHVFMKNFGKGCLGGLIKYSAKSQTYYLRNTSNTYLAPLNRVYFFLGHSIAMNAAMNKRTFENYYCNFYGLNFKFQPYELKENRFHVKVSVSTVYSICAFTLDKHKLDLYKSLEYGQFYFDLTRDVNNSGIRLDGLALFNTFGIRKFTNGNIAYYIIPHEIVHTYQAYDYFPISGFYKTKLNQSLNKNKAYKSVTKYIDIDYEALFMSTAFQFQPNPQYYRNFYEYEAEHFSRRSYMIR